MYRDLSDSSFDSTEALDSFYWSALDEEQHQHRSYQSRSNKKRNYTRTREAGHSDQRKLNQREHEKSQSDSEEEGPFSYMPERVKRPSLQRKKENGPFDPPDMKKRSRIPRTSGMKEEASTSGALLVAAIDFGTTYSGWAFSFKHEFEKDPTKVSSTTWTGSQLLSLKCPTCILIKPDGKTLEAFGFEAESRYSELKENDEYKKWYYFRRFKMQLWNEPIHKDSVLEDECGRELSSLTVFSLSIRFMKENLWKKSDKQVTGLRQDDVHWVVTVPAIWNDSAKGFMRLAAEEAGISADKLTIALEPEAASIYCSHLPVEKVGETNMSAFRAGKKYLVLDAGGGTIDMTVHEVCEGKNLKEIHKASGGDWGGTKVDDAFIDFLCKITDKKAIKRFKDENIDDYIELLRDFETKKRAIEPTKSGKVTFKIPSSLSDLIKHETGRALQDTLPMTGYGEQLSMPARDKLRIDADIMRSLFSSSISNILEHVDELLRKPECKGVEAILMVGGYSESLLLQDAIKKRFSRLKILVPQEAGLAVLKGAVIYGHCPMTIQERVSKHTYGFRMSKPFNEAKHPLSKRKVYENGEVRCIDVFDVFVRAGDKLIVGEVQHKKSCFPVGDRQKGMCFAMFATSDQNPKYVTDFGCKQIGFVRVPLSGSGTDRSVVVCMIFGGTEIRVECVEKRTGKITRLNVDFLM